MFTKQSSNLFNQKVTKLKCLFNILQETFLKIIQNVQHPFPVLLAEPPISILSAIYYDFAFVTRTRETQQFKQLLVECTAS